MHKNMGEGWLWVAVPATALVTILGAAETLSNYTPVAEGNDRAAVAQEESPNQFKLILSAHGKPVAERSGFSDKLAMRDIGQEYVRTGNKDALNAVRLYTPAAHGAYHCQIDNRRASVSFNGMSNRRDGNKLSGDFFRNDKKVYSTADETDFVDAAASARKFCERNILPS